MKRKKKEYGRLLVNGSDLGPATRDPDTGTIEAGPPIHESKPCDDYIDDDTQPQSLRTWLARAREPAHGMTNPAPWPECYADFIGNGRVVRLTMASRLGSVGWSEDLTQTEGYQYRGWLDQLTNFRDKP